MKKYKNYIIAAGILIVGIILGNVFSGGNKQVTVKDGEHEYVQDPITKLWTCAMHPQIKMKEPGNCPICGMELVPLDEGTDSKEKIDPSEIVMSEEAIQLANVQTSVVEKSDAVKEIHILGRVKADERKLYSQVSHIPGRIERLYVNFTGEKVRVGQKIVRLYSPDLISAQKELFEAIKSKSIYPELYTAARNKLKLWKLTDKQISKIEKSGAVEEEIDILSDYNGYVMKRNVELGDHIKTGGKLFDIANLSTVWVMFEAYEADIPWIQLNNVVNFTIQAIPNKDFKGKVTYVDPFVSSNTRVAKVRVELNNPGYKLLPEMYATGIIHAVLPNVESAVLVPKSAVLWTGKRAVVYVKVPHEKTISFIYREIILGEDAGQFYIVKEGLDEGEIVATNGVFRIDASAQLVGKKSMMNPEGGKVSTGGHAGMDMGGDKKMDEAKTESEMVDHSKMIMIDKSKINPKFKEQLGNVVDEYITLKNSLANDDNSSVEKQTKNIKSAVDKVDMLLLLGDAHNVWMNALKKINEDIATIQNNKNIEEQRKVFGLLGKKLSEVIDILGIKTPNNKILYLEFCPMADDSNGAYWLSYDKEIANPFLGQDMPTCGEVKKEYK